jgi:hypothetical protein
VRRGGREQRDASATLRAQCINAAAEELRKSQEIFSAEKQEIEN